MKKNLTVIGLVFFLLIVGLCGCQERVETPEIKFIQEDGMLMVDFVEKTNLTWIISILQFHQAIIQILVFIPILILLIENFMVMEPHVQVIGV